MAAKKGKKGGLSGGVSQCDSTVGHHRAVLVKVSLSGCMACQTVVEDGSQRERVLFLEAGTVVVIG